MNYYRARGIKSKDNKLDGSNGMFLMGEDDKHISSNALAATAKEYPKIRTEVVAKANHNVQEHEPIATNALLRDFLGPASHFTAENLA